jgi:hypothetical protein
MYQTHPQFLNLSQILLMQAMPVENDALREPSIYAVKKCPRSNVLKRTYYIILLALARQTRDGMRLR